MLFYWRWWLSVHASLHYITLLRLRFNLILTLVIILWSWLEAKYPLSYFYLLWAWNKTKNKRLSLFRPFHAFLILRWRMQALPLLSYVCTRDVEQGTQMITVYLVLIGYPVETFGYYYYYYRGLSPQQRLWGGAAPPPSVDILKVKGYTSNTNIIRKC